MKDSKPETVEEVEPTVSPSASRQDMLREVFELQMGMLWLAQQAMREVTTPHEVQPPHVMVLGLLDGLHPDIGMPRQGTLSMSDISRILDVPPATATAMIDRMTAQGLVERGPSDQDRRMVMVRLTPAGRATLQKINDVCQQLQRDAFTVLSDDELAMHLNLVKRLQHGFLQRVTHGPAPASPRPQENS